MLNVNFTKDRENTVLRMFRNGLLKTKMIRAVGFKGLALKFNYRSLMCTYSLLATLFMGSVERYCNHKSLREADLVGCAGTLRNLRNGGL